MGGLARRAWVVAVAGAVVIVMSVVTPVTIADARKSQSLAFAGVCAFGVVPGAEPLVITMSSTGVTLGGKGSCQGNAGSGTAELSLQGFGDFACRRSYGSVTGSILFNPQPPDSQLSVTATAVLGVGTLDVVITDGGGDIYASGSYAWADTRAGCETVATDGLLGFTDS